MADFSVRILQCFEKAKLVNHYYWLHTNADGGKQISVENLQRIIERMTRLKVEKRLVQFDGSNIRGNYERYADHIIINIRAGQPIEWLRYTIVKELCHALNDLEEEFSPRPEDTIRALVNHAGLAIREDASPALQSERLAEITAIELLYPVELREEDILGLNKGLTIAQIVTERGVPSPLVQRALKDDYLAACKHFWSALANVNPPRLAPL